MSNEGLVLTPKGVKFLEYLREVVKGTETLDLDYEMAMLAAPAEGRNRIEIAEMLIDMLIDLPMGEQN